MHIRGIVALSAGALLLVGCNPFSRGQAVRVTETDDRLAMRWHGTLSSPQTLAGAVQMEGSAWMAPAGTRENGVNGGASTEVSVELRNAAPGGEHPWEVGRGRCGAAEGMLGSMEDYPPLRVGNDGQASATATLDRRLPESGSYFVSVFASRTNRQLVVACGNLAPPSG